MKEPNSYLAKTWGKFSALSEKNYTFLEEMKSEETCTTEPKGEEKPQRGNLGKHQEMVWVILLKQWLTEQLWGWMLQLPHIAMMPQASSAAFCFCSSNQADFP